MREVKLKANQLNKVEDSYELKTKISDLTKEFGLTETLKHNHKNIEAYIDTSSYIV